MARSTGFGPDPKPERHSFSQELIGRISETITSHSRLSAAAAFQMGVLLGQVMNNTGALDGLKRKMAGAQGALASNFPTFGLFDSEPAKKRRGGRKAAGRRLSTGNAKRPRTAKRGKRAARD
jgi:hypothetical protein